MTTAPDEIDFRRVLAAPYGDGKGLRDALDVEVNGVSLSQSLDAAPFDIDVLRSDNRTANWSHTTKDVAVLNCTCGEVACGGIFVEVIADDETITWTGPAIGRTVTFDRSDFETSLTAAMSE